MVGCLVSTAVSKSCKAPLTVSESAIVEPVNVPKSSEASVTPESVIKWSTSSDALVCAELSNFASKALCSPFVFAIVRSPSAMLGCLLSRAACSPFVFAIVRSPSAIVGCTPASAAV